MQLLGYGEDALTLWALKNKLDVILDTLNDLSGAPTCQVFFRPSFGRRGGESSPQFGEFDFIILAQACLYLGESKWEASSEEIREGVLELRAEQKLRHRLFRFYVEQWAFGDYSNWGEFIEGAKEELRRLNLVKPLAPKNSLLAINLQTVLGAIRNWYASRPHVRDVVLYFHNGRPAEQLPRRASEGFELVLVDYSEATFDNFIRVLG